MLTSDAFTSPERLEQNRRSIAMLATGTAALNREEALLLLDRLMTFMRAAPPDHDRR